MQIELSEQDLSIAWQLTQGPFSELRGPAVDAIGELRAALKPHVEELQRKNGAGAQREVSLATGPAA